MDMIQRRWVEWQTRWWWPSGLQVTTLLYVSFWDKLQFDCIWQEHFREQDKHIRYFREDKQWPISSKTDFLINLPGGIFRKLYLSQKNSKTNCHSSSQGSTPGIQPRALVKGNGRLVFFMPRETSVPAPNWSLCMGVWTYAEALNF